MPRSLPIGLTELLKSGYAESHSTLELSLPSDFAPAITHYFATARLTISGVTYDRQLRSADAVKTSLTQAADRVTVELQNVDTILGVDLLQVADSLYGANVKFGRYWKDLRSAATFHHILLTGAVAGVEVNENVAKLTIISDTYAAVSVGAREQVLRQCRFQVQGEFRGEACGYSGALLTCNGLFDSADGCEGRHGDPLKFAKFGGFVYIEGKNTVAGAAALPIPASNQLIKLVDLTANTETAKLQQPFLALDNDRFHATNNSTDLRTEIVPKGLATGFENAVDDYDAPFDGVSDATSELQSAITAAEAAGGGTVYLNPGIFKTTGITLTGRVKLVGSFEGATIIYSTTNAPIVDCVGSAFFCPVIENITVRGSKTAGTSQIGIRFDSAGDCLGARLDKVKIQTTGGTGLYVGTVFSSVFRDVFLDDCAGYPVEINAPFQPNLYFENVYPGTLGANYPVGFMVRQAQNALFNNCNGLNAIPLNSAWMVVGQKNGLYGASSDNSASVQLVNCNVESYHTWGIRCLRNSSVQLLGKNTFARAAITTTLSVGINSSVTSIPLTGNLTTLLFPTSGDAAELLIKEGGNVERMTVTSRTTSAATVVRGTPSYAFTTAATVYSAHARGIEYDVDDIGAYPSFFAKATIADESGIQDGVGEQEQYYHGQFFHSNELPPAALVGEGMACTQSPPASTYWNGNRSRIEPLYRVGDYHTRTTITGDYTFTMPGARYIACTVSAPTAITLWWASWERHPKTVIVADLSGNAATHNITISAGGGGTISGGTVTIDQDYGAVILLPDPLTGDWRVIATYGGGAISGSGSANRLAIWSGTSAQTSVSGLEYDAGSAALLSPGRFYGANTSASFPTFAFTSDPETGFYLTTAGVMGFASSAANGGAGGNVFLLKGDRITLNDNRISWDTSETVHDLIGSGSPEGVVTASIGSVYRRTNGSTATTLYVKESGTGNTGWVAVGAGGGGSGTVSSGTANQLAYYASSGTTVSGLTSANNSVLVTDGSGVPSWATSLPSGTTLNSVAIVTISGTQTLTNKTISGASNTLSNIGNSSLTNSAITIAGTSTSLGGSISLDTITGLSSTGLVKRTGANTLAIATSGTDYEVPLTFSTGLTRSTNTITVNTSQNIATLSNLTSNGLVTTSGGVGTLGVTVPGTGVLTALAVNVGSSGAFVTNGGALGTPSSGTLTNATGLPIATGVSGLGANVATFLATPSSANLAAAVTDETGSGALVFATSPTLTTPTIAKIANLTSNGFVKTSGGDGTLSVDTNSYALASSVPSGANPTATIGLSAVNGSATSFLRSDGAPALSQAIAPTWTGLHTFNPGTTAQTVIQLDIAALGGAGTRDSHFIAFRARSNNGVGHTIDWRMLASPTSNAGASVWALQTQLDSGGYSNAMLVNESGEITSAAIVTDFLTCNGSIVALDLVDSLNGYLINGGATSGNYLRGNGTAFVSAALNASDLASGTVAVARGGTGQNSYTNGQLLIGNTTGNTLTKATLTATANQTTVTNGGGSITLGAAPLLNAAAIFQILHTCV